MSNPPYSTKWEGDDNPTLNNDPRFAPAGVLAPKSKADLAFTMHMLSWLAADGTAAIVEFPGVLYRGGKEQKIRKYLLEGNFINAVIQLPPNLFFGTSIATCIIVLKKWKNDDSVLFIDASERFVHVGNQNQLSPDDIAAIMDAYVKREPVEHFSAVASLEDIRKNDYVLSVRSYVKPKDTREDRHRRTQPADLRHRRHRERTPHSDRRHRRGFGELKWLKRLGQGYFGRTPVSSRNPCGMQSRVRLLSLRKIGSLNIRENS